MNWDHAGVLERRGQRRFPQEPLAKPRILGKLGRKQLQRDPALERELNRPG